MIWRQLKAVLILPVNVLIVIPALIAWATRETRFASELRPFSDPAFWMALPPAVVGLMLGGWSMSLFVRHGDGTPAPWDPPQKLVIRGPYRHVRNPMISGVVFMLVAEAIALQSWPISVWAAVFFAANSFYFPLSEEVGLERRFGEDYRRYKTHVPRWIPRLRAWNPPRGE